AREPLRLAGAGRSGVDVAAHIIGRHALELHLRPINLEATVETPEAERQHLAHVAENDVERRKAIEQATENEPQRMTAPLRGPAPDRRREAGIIIEHWRTQCHMHRMDVDRNGQRRDALPEWQVARVVKVDAVAVAVDECALEAERRDAALELARGCARLLH